jgi:hypothetical protein
VDESENEFIGGKRTRRVLAVDGFEAERVVAQLAAQALALREPVDEAVLVRVANGPRAAARMKQRALGQLGGTPAYAALGLVVAQRARHGCVVRVEEQKLLKVTNVATLGTGRASRRIATTVVLEIRETKRCC